LHGTYAYLGVTAFWRAQRACETFESAREFADVEFARWRKNALDATGTMLCSGQLTPLGERFVEGMRSRLKQWCDEPVSDTARTTAARLSGAHHDQWLATYPQDTG
jgi:hypothetical protein